MWLTLLEDADGGRGLVRYEAHRTLGARDGQHVQDGQAEPLGKERSTLVSKSTSQRSFRCGRY